MLKERPAFAKTAEVTISPEWARQQLEHNSNNRRLKPSVVESYSAEMKAGRWAPGVAVVAIDWNGQLVNGQHTLSAIVQSNTPIIVTLKTGVDPASFAAYDQQTKRGGRDVLGLLGYQNARDLAAAIRWDVVLGNGTYGEPRGATQIAPTALEEVLRTRLDLVDAVADARSACERQRLISPSLLAPALRRFRLQDREKAYDFLEKFKTGAGLAAGDPILALRNRLVAERGIANRAPSQELLAFLVRAWLAFVEGRTLGEVKGSIKMKDGSRIFPQLPKA